MTLVLTCQSSVHSFYLVRIPVLSSDNLSVVVVVVVVVMVVWLMVVWLWLVQPFMDVLDKCAVITSSCSNMACLTS